MSSRHNAFTCPYGYVDSYGKRSFKKYDVVGEALGAMNAYCNKHNINIVELFSRFDADGSMSVTHEEFELGLRVGLRMLVGWLCLGLCDYDRI